MFKTYSARPKEVEAKWLLVDARDKTLGRLASKIATVLRGKHKATFTPHIDTGDFVVVINARHIRVSGNKLKDKHYKTYSGYPGGLKKRPLAELLAHKPTEVLSHAVKGMLPKGPLGNRMFKKLKVYPDENHRQVAQKPQPVEL